MQFTISSRDLKPVLDNLSKIAKSKTTLPILDNFKLELTDDELFITASDMEVSITSVLTPESVETTGSSCVLADKLYDVVRNFKDEMLTFKLNDTHMTIKSKSGNFYVPVESAENFPLDHKVNESDVLQLPMQVLVSGVQKTLFAAFDNFEYSPTLCGVYLDLSTNGTSIVATDKQKLAIYSSEPIVASDSGVIIPTKMANLIIGSASEDEAYVTMMFNDKTIVARMGYTTIRSRTIEGQYPNYKSIIPDTLDTSTIIDTGALIDALKRVSVFANSKSKVVKLKFTAGLLTVLGEFVDFGLEADESVDAVYDGEEVVIALNSRYMMEVLTKIDTERCTIEVGRNIVMIYPIGERNFKALIAQVAL